DEFQQVGAQQRFAAGEVHLQDADIGGFIEHPEPGGGVEFFFAAGHLERVRAVDAAQRATVGHLEQQPYRRLCLHDVRSNHFRSTASLRNSVTSASSSSSG